jgi:hypothetical protein
MVAQAVLAVVVAVAEETIIGVVVDAVVGHRRLMSVVVVESWATGLVIVGPRPRRIRPAPSKMRSPR